MFSSIIGGAVASLSGGAPGVISGPKVPTALLFGSLLGQLTATGLFSVSDAADVNVLLTIAFGAVLLSGLIQLLFGVTRLGSIVKFIPYPVIAAIRNCTALLIIEGQLAGCLGLPKGGFSQVLSSISEFQPVTLSVAVLTGLLALIGGKYIHKAAVPTLSIAAGSSVYYLFSCLHPEVMAGPTLGYIPSVLPKPEYFIRFLGLFSDLPYMKVVLPVFSTAVAMAILNSIATLISLVILQSLSGKRFDANRELVGQGLGNVAGSIFGGISSAGFVSRTSQNYNAGGRSKFSGVVNSITVLLLIMVFSGVISFVPKAAFSGLVFVIGCQLIDKWSFKELYAFLSGSKSGSDTILNAVILVVVIVIGAAYDLMIAVLVGVVISVIVFVIQMSRTPVRRCYSRRQAQSRRSRLLNQMQFLSDRGAEIVVLELEGAIFFGSADNIASEVETLISNGARYVVLDLKRVVRIDSTAVRVIQQIQARLAKDDYVLALSYVPIYREGTRGIVALELVRHIGERYVFEDTDRALEYFEEELLKELPSDSPDSDQFPLHQILGLDVLDPLDAAMIADYIDRCEFKEGDFVITRGARVEAIYFIVKGLADSMIYLSDVKRSRRLGTYTPGTYFGESALLEGEPSPVNIVAHGQLVCYRISLNDFERMKVAAPALAMAILTTINRTLAFRVNSAIDMITNLDH